MQDHYQLSDEVYAKLLKKKVTVTHMFRAIPLFDPNDCGEPIDKVGLMYYVDEKGDFESKPLLPHRRIAQAVFDRLPIMDKIAVAEYVELVENNYEDVDDD